MMMTCNGEIQHPTSDGGEKVSFGENANGDDRFPPGTMDAALDASNVTGGLQRLESQRPSKVDSQGPKSNDYMQHFFSEALVRSGQRKNGTGNLKTRLVEETEAQPPDVVLPPSEDNQSNASCVKTSGLDLLGSLALTKPPAEPSTSPAANLTPQSLDKTVREWVAIETAAKMKKEERMYVDKVLEWDVLCGRGGKSNHWSGNKRYRQVVSEMKAMYKNQDDKSAKTDLSRAIVDYVCNYGGRFLKKEGYTERYYVLTRAEARKKTSQALRETKEPKWTL
jgi:hypothetical protein